MSVTALDTDYLLCTGAVASTGKIQTNLTSWNYHVQGFCQHQVCDYCDIERTAILKAPRQEHF